MKKVFLILLYLLSPILPILALLCANPGKYTDLGNLYSMVIGVIAYTWLTWQFVISARPKFIEINFGMDKLYRFHGIIAVIAITMVVFHKFVKEAIFGEVFMTRLGSISMLLFISVSVLSVLLMVNSKITTIQPFKLIRKTVEFFKIFKYEHYKLLHNLTIAALFLMQGHVLLASGVKANFLVFNIFMGYFLLGLLFYLYHKVFKQWLLLERSYVVSSVKKDSLSMWTIALSPKYRKIFNYKPGQFGFFTFHSKSIQSEEHPFSISSSPTNNLELTITVKELGDFTKNIGKLKLGDEVLVEGPYGKFSYLVYPNEDAIVFVVGGVGITPVLSMLRHMRDTSFKKKVILIWGMNTLEDYISRAEIEDITSKLDDVKVIPVVAQDKNHIGEAGFIDYEKLRRILKTNGVLKLNTGYYLCGPAMLLDSTIKNLKNIGVENTKIHHEKFSL